MGVLIGALAIRSRGIYFANITLAFAQMIFFFSLQANFTHGEDGIQAVPRGMLFGSIRRGLSGSLDASSIAECVGRVASSRVMPLRPTKAMWLAPGM